MSASRRSAAVWPGPEIQFSAPGASVRMPSLTMRNPVFRPLSETAQLPDCRHSDPISATASKMTFIEKWRGYEQCSSRR
jgi:hypothetical protein